MMNRTMRPLVLLLAAAIASLVGFATSETPTSMDISLPMATEGHPRAKIRTIGPLDDIKQVHRAEAYCAVSSKASSWPGTLGLSNTLPSIVKIPIKAASEPPNSSTRIGDGYTSSARPEAHHMRSAISVTMDVNNHVHWSAVLGASVETLETPTRSKCTSLGIRERYEEDVLSKSNLASTSACKITTATVSPADKIGSVISASESTITSRETTACTKSIPAAPSADGKMTSSTFRSVVFSTTLVTATSTRTRTTVTVTASPNSTSSAEMSEFTSTTTTTTPEPSTFRPTKSTPTAVGDLDDSPTSTIASSTKSAGLSTRIPTTAATEQTSTTKTAEPASSTRFTTPTVTSSTIAASPNSSQLTSCSPSATPTTESSSTTFETSTGNSSAKPSDHTLTITGTGGIAFSGANKYKMWSLLGSSCGLAILVYYILW